MTEAQRALYVHNLTLARDFIKTLAPERLYLETWCFRETGTCGTLYCTAGWLTTHSFFGQFMYLNNNDVLAPTFIPGWKIGSVNEAMSYKYRWLDVLFGPDAFFHVFAVRGEGEFDEELLDDVILSDYALALARLDLAIERIENMPVESAAG